MTENNFKTESILPFDCNATFADWEARGKTALTAESIEIVASLFNACDTADKIEK